MTPVAATPASRPTGRYAIPLKAQIAPRYIARVAQSRLTLSSDGDDPPHAVPVSYGYQPADEAFYFRLAVSDEKGPLADRPATFVVHGDTDDGWHSVVAAGRLERTTDADTPTSALAGMRGVEIPLVDVFGRSTATVAFEFYRLVPESFTGRVESSTAP